MDGLATNYGDRLKVVKMEVDPNPNSVAQCKVEGVPALRLFQDGKVLEATEGALSKQKVEGIVAAHVA
jgi:thioredoxin 1